MFLLLQEDASNSWREAFVTLGPLVTEYSVSVLGVVALLVAGWMIGNWIRRMLRKGLDRAHFDPTLSRFFTNAVRWLILVLAIMACLSVFNVQLTMFAAILGAAGLAVGLALQGSLANIAAGIMLLVFRPFKVGDAVTAAGQGGIVNELDLFTTSIDTPDGRRVILPNGQIFGNTIENISHHAHRRVDVNVGVAYDADLDRTRDVLLRAAGAVSGGLSSPAPDAVLMGLGDYAVGWQVQVWAKRDQYLAVRQAAIRGVKKALDDAGIAIPFPRYDVHVDRAALA